MWSVLQKLLIIVALGVFVGCNSPISVPGSVWLSDTGARVVRAEVGRATSPQVGASDLAELADGNSAFAFELYQLLKEEKKDDNLFYSPYSISLALAMTYAGARGATEGQMADALHFSLPQERLHPAFNALDLELASREESARSRSRSRGGEGFRLKAVNVLWGERSYQFLPEFLNTLALNYGAGIRLVDFINAPKQSRRTINDWVSEETEGRIKELIPPELINTLTRLVLTNIIYFNASWETPFEADLTEDRAFYLLDGDQVMVPMMGQTAYYRYAVGDGYQAVELPYEGQQLAMVIFLPGVGEFQAFEDGLGAEQLDAILSALGRPRKVILTVPRFDIESDFVLAQTLAALGMPDAFTPDAANFSGMDGSHNLFIRDVVHQTFVSVDEAGTEASAGTAVIMEYSAPPPIEPVEVKMDRPFIFLIRDIETGTVLFVGRVLDPSR